CQGVPLARQSLATSDTDPPSGAGRGNSRRFPVASDEKLITRKWSMELAAHPFLNRSARSRPRHSRLLPIVGFHVPTPLAPWLHLARHTGGDAEHRNHHRPLLARREEGPEAR